MNYNDTPRKEVIRGVKTWTNEKNGFRVMFLRYDADPDKDPLRNGKEWYEKERKGMPKAKWNKEYEGDFESSSSRLIFGEDYCDFKQQTHIIPSFPVEGELIFSLDFGQSNPTAGLVGCVTQDGTLYIIDEYFKPAIPSVSSREMFIKFSEHLGIDEETARNSLPEDRLDILRESFQLMVIDPSTRSKNRTKTVEGEEVPYSVIEDFFDNGWDFEPGINDVNSGITKMRELFSVDGEGKSKLYIFGDKCPNLAREIVKYKYKELSESQLRSSNQSESPVKKDDHAVDALRYMVVSRPVAPVRKEKGLSRIQKDIRNSIKPSNMSYMWDAS